MRTSFYLTDIDYVTINEEPIIRLFGSTSKGERVIVLDKNFKPYFWAITEKTIKVKDEKLIKTEERTKKFLGTSYKALKIIVKHPTDVKKISDKVKLMRGVLSVKENDISYYKRYLIDKGVEQLSMLSVEGSELSAEGSNADRVIMADKVINSKGDYEPRVIAFDIETFSAEGEDSGKIIMISLWSNTGLKKVLTIKPCKRKECEQYDSEEEMINGFLSIIDKEKPDIIVTYNGDEFDWPYLKERMKKHRIKKSLGIDGSKLKLVRKAFRKAAKIKGLVHIDLYQFVLNIISPTLKTNTLDLDSVANELISEHKKEMDWEQFFIKWTKGDINQLVDYSLNDARVTYKLFDNLKPIIFELTRLVGQPLFDVSRKTYSQLVEDYLMKRAGEFNELVPNKPSPNEVSSRYRRTFTGGFVFEPKPGIYEDIAGLDFRSLYPSIMVSFNICPTTINQKCKSYNKVKVGSKEYKFCKTKGFVPTIIKELVDKRKLVKQQLKKDKNPLLEARSYALKTVTNATYGFYGYPRARWYCFGCAESITSLGRDFINKTISKSSSQGFTTIYADTDGFYITRNGKSKQSVVKLMNSINKELPGIMELELEDYYPRGLFTPLRKGEKGAKKRYALIDEQGVLVIKGFEFVRGDWANIAKRTQYEVFKALLKDKSEDKAISVVKQTIDQLRQGKTPVSDLIIRTQLTRPIDQYKAIGPHVAVAKRLIDKGFDIKPGSMIEYLVVEGKGLIRDKSRHPTELKNEKYDPEYYINNQVMPAVDRIMKMLGIDEKSFERTKQRKLGSFF